jgi:hypothetical protein
MGAGALVFPGKICDKIPNKSDVLAPHALEKS